MSEVFEGYERQYREISAGLSRKCAAASALDGEKKKQKLSEIQADVQESESLIRRMDSEARSLQPTVRAELLSKLRPYKSDLNNIKSEIKKVSVPNTLQATREELLDSGISDTLAASSDQRGRLMMTSETLNQSSGRIREIQRTALDTEEIGVSILQNLHNQRQTVLHAHKTELHHGLVLDESHLDTAQASCFFGHVLQKNFNDAKSISPNWYSNSVTLSACCLAFLWHRFGVAWCGRLHRQKQQDPGVHVKVEQVVCLGWLHVTES